MGMTTDLQSLIMRHPGKTLELRERTREIRAETEYVSGSRKHLTERVFRRPGAFVGGDGHAAAAPYFLHIRKRLLYHGLFNEIDIELVQALQVAQRLIHFPSSI